MRQTLILGIIFSVLICGTVYSSPSSNESPKEKSVGAGILLGSIGITGIFVPGTMGWGNFYSKDYFGFGVLNIGGSILNIVTWSMAISLVVQYGSKYPTNSAQYIIGSISGFGSIIFAIVSVVSGGSSVDQYNLKLKIKKTSLSLVPNIETLGASLKYEF